MDEGTLKTLNVVFIPLFGVLINRGWPAALRKTAKIREMKMKKENPVTFLRVQVGISGI